MNGYIKLKSRNTVKLGLKDEQDNIKLDENGHEVFIEFDLEDINVIDNYSKAISLCEKAGIDLKTQIAVINKRKDDKQINSFITKNQKDYIDAEKKYFKDIEHAMNLFLGENGFTKIFGNKRYLTMLDDLSDMLEPIMPLLKVNVDSIQEKIITKYKTHDEDVLKDE
ncbi:MAG: hypothetical protein HP057_00800 [Erysipelatoclostridium sp.]|nr:hypothetical protein [Thomasclavelia sp.]